MMYTADVDVAERNVTETRAMALMDKLQAYHPAVGQAPRGWLSITLTFPAEGVGQATQTALTLIENATGATALRAEVMTEAERDAREGFQHIPDLVSATEAGELLGKSRMRIHQMITEGKFTTATRIGNGWAIARSEVEAKAITKGES